MRRTILDHTPDGLKRRLADLERQVADLQRVRNPPPAYNEAPKPKPYASVVVAPSDCQAPGAANADYVLPGGDDTAMLTEAIDTAWAVSAGPLILILDGTVYLSDYVSGPHIRGMGGQEAGTTIVAIANVTTLIEGWTLSDLRVTSASGQNATTAAASVLYAGSDLRVDGFGSTSTGLYVAGWARAVNVAVDGVGRGILADHGSQVANAVVDNCGVGYEGGGSLTNFDIQATATGVVDTQGTKASNGEIFAPTGWDCRNTSFLSNVEIDASTVGIDCDGDAHVSNCRIGGPSAGIDNDGIMILTGSLVQTAGTDITNTGTLHQAANLINGVWVP